RMKEHKAMLDSVKRGDEVVTSGGLIGRVTEVKDDEISVEIAKDVKIRVRRDAIASINSNSPVKE
ncbi:preprotein translocase subunit YajC, partial [bacterium]